MTTNRAVFVLGHFLFFATWADMAFSRSVLGALRFSFGAKGNGSFN